MVNGFFSPSRTDLFYTSAPSVCKNANGAVYTLSNIPGSTITDISYALCQYKEKVDAYLEKTPNQIVVDERANDNMDKESKIMLENVNMFIGIVIISSYLYALTS